MISDILNTLYGVYPRYILVWMALSQEVQACPVCWGLFILAASCAVMRDLLRGFLLTVFADVDTFSSQCVASFHVAESSVQILIVFPAIEGRFCC